MAALQYAPDDWISPREYLKHERAAETKSEYVNGRIYAMSGASRSHVRISTNITASLHRQLRGKPCEPFNNDLRLRVPQTPLYTYPDVMVACPPLEWEDDEFDILTNPVVIVEVLSPSTENYDRTDKFEHYKRLPSLRDYLLVAQDRARIEHYHREADGRWTYAVATSPDERVELPGIGCTLEVAEVYERVNFDSPPPLAP